MSPWKRVGVAAVVGSAVIFAGTLIAYAATNDIGNSNSGTVAQSASDVTSSNTNTTGANNNITVKRGASYSPPSLSRAEIGTEVMQLHSFLGGATFANTELDTRVRLKIEVIIAAYREKLIDEAMAKARIGLALSEMDSIQRERVVPILGFSCNHRTIFNLVGLLCN